LQVPGEVVFPGLEHGARRRRGVAAALQVDPLEEWLVRVAVVLVDHVGSLIVRGEGLDLVGTSANRIKEEGVVGCFPILDVEHMLGIDVAEFRSGMWLEPVGVRLGEEDLRRQRIDDLDRLDRLIDAGGGGGVRGIDDPLPSEEDVIGGQRLAVGPGDPIQQLVGDALEVLGQ
jgi:hypothetical protein